jgi:uncharacterized membrane protein YhaH (DUF805 family)
MNWYFKVLKEHYADFSGRARRKEFWMFALFNFIFIIVIYAVLGGVAAATDNPAILFIGHLYFLAILIPSLALVTRRLHDVGKSGWFYFIGLIPLIGGIWLLILECTDSQHGTNKWGENPKGIGNDSAINQLGKE